MTQEYEDMTTFANRSKNIVSLHVSSQPKRELKGFLIIVISFTYSFFYFIHSYGFFLISSQ